MNHEDFDIDSLARYLHLTPQQVERLAERDRVPGRKVAGKWRFSQAQIHHWLEDRIGLLNEGELDQVDGVLERAATSDDEKPISIAAMIPSGGIAYPLVARTRNSVINAMSKLAAETGLLWDPDKMADAVRCREEMQSTALDIGIALLHAPRPLPNILSEAFLVMGRTSQGIPFGGSRSMTDIFFLICSTGDRNHLRTLARLSRLLSSGDLLTAVREAEDAATIRKRIIEFEEALGEFALRRTCQRSRGHSAPERDDRFDRQSRAGRRQAALVKGFAMIDCMFRTASWITICAVITLTVVAVSTATGQDQLSSSDDVDKELVNWEPYSGNPIFTGTGMDTWDQEIRERGYILREGDLWHLWYTGYNPSRGPTMFLGYATSPDGIAWKRHDDHPVFDGSWVEDVCVVKHEGVFHMFAEGRRDIAHRLTSKDGIHWKDHGSLDIRTTSGQPLSVGPYGTPTIWIEGSTWYLFYERRDRGVWLATSTDQRIWKNVQDEPVIARGPEPYDRHAVAMNQVIRYEDRYVGLYHANDDPQWKGPWTTCLATSNDLVHWKKYHGNPVIASNDSSGILVHDGRQFRLYTMHPLVKLWLPAASSETNRR